MEVREDPGISLSTTIDICSPCSVMFTLTAGVSNTLCELVSTKLALLSPCQPEASTSLPPFTIFNDRSSGENVDINIAIKIAV